MRVLVTGGAGFIGSRMAARLCERGDTVWAVDDLSLGVRANVAPLEGRPGFRFVEADVRSTEFADAMQEFRPERVAHLAANSDIQRGIREPHTDLERTFLTTFSVLEAMHRCGSRELVFSSTSAVYGDVPGEIGEDHGPLQPISLYGAAKLASEAYVSAWCHLYGIRAWQFRFPNVIGPQLTHGVIYDLVRKLFADPKRLVVLGDGTQEKPYLHVDDLLDAIDLALAKPVDPVTTWNVAGEGATTVRQIAEIIREEAGFPGAEIAYGSEPRGWPGDVPKFAYDTSRIRALGWRPRMTSTEAVRAAVRAEVARCRP